MRRCRRVSWSASPARASLGLARTGTASGNTSGDIILAFSTGNAMPMNGAARVMDAKLLSTDHVDPLFRAAVEATEEAVVNALMKGETMTGINGNTVYALPYDRLRQVMAKYGRPLQDRARRAATLGEAIARTSRLVGRSFSSAFRSS